MTTMDDLGLQSISLALHERMPTRRDIDRVECWLWLVRDEGWERLLKSIPHGGIASVAEIAAVP